MKLYEIAKPYQVISEGGFVEPNLMLSVRNIIQRGRADNHFEFMVITRLLQLLQLGQFYKNSNPLFDGNISTNKCILDHLRALPPAQMVAIAQKLWDLLQIKDADSLSAYANPTQEAVEWVKLFTAREAND
jgi:hypothetical protein